MFFPSLSSCACLPCRFLLSPICISSTQVYLLYISLFHLAGMASLSPLHHWVLLSEADSKVCVCTVWVCTPVRLCALARISSLLVQWDHVQMFACMCVRACTCATPGSQGVCWCSTPADVKHWLALLNVYTLSMSRVLMEEQCSVHSTHWGTLKFTVILSKIHCTDTRIHAARERQRHSLGQVCRERSWGKNWRGLLKGKKECGGANSGTVTKAWKDDSVGKEGHAS